MNTLPERLHGDHQPTADLEHCRWCGEVFPCEAWKRRALPQLGTWARVTTLSTIYFLRAVAAPAIKTIRNPEIQQQARDALRQRMLGWIDAASSVDRALSTATTAVQRVVAHAAAIAPKPQRVFAGMLRRFRETVGAR